MIPGQAVEAAAKVLLGYTGGCVCHEGYTGRNLIDPECRYHDVPPEVAREILEAAAPYMGLPYPPIDAPDPQCVGVAEGNWGQETRCGLKGGHSGECQA